MTQNKHCNLEKICHLYFNAMIGIKRNQKCVLIPCEFDTRIHPTTPEAKRE